MAEEKRQEEEFSFVKEKIKRQRFYQNKTFRRVIFQLALAVVCGVVACLAFVVSRPWMEERFQKDERQEISLPREEEKEEEKEEEEPAVVPEEPEPPKEQIVITESVELELEDYRKLYGKLKGVAEECAKSLVTVTAASNDTDWFNETYESREQTSGLLVGNNGVELLILTVYSRVQSADQLQVTLVNHSSVDAVLKNYDTVTDLAILSVNLADLPEGTMDQIQMANLGGSRNMRAGDLVIAAGSPAGVAGSVLYGNLVASGHTVSVIDGEYELLLTDMPKASESSGVLVNLEGEIVGLLEQGYQGAGSRDTLTAYGISGVKDVIEHLSNSQDLVYIGITGADVTQERAEAQSLPVGVYITGVEMNSPAMDAGIQQGDVIVEISGQAITSISEIQKMLLKFSREQVIQVLVMRLGKEGYKEIPCSVTLDRL
ncbi:MAG: PDZ domain-containing protein [Lachnospiraceae bacterium]|jgi:serine protease Do|nr:PDZ domain-containing protein [Lachnospiraceae bacterium]